MIVAWAVRLKPVLVVADKLFIVNVLKLKLVCFVTFLPGLRLLINMISKSDFSKLTIVQKMNYLLLEWLKFFFCFYGVVAFLQENFNI